MGQVPGHSQQLRGLAASLTQGFLVLQLPALGFGQMLAANEHFARIDVPPAS